MSIQDTNTVLEVWILQRAVSEHHIVIAQSTAAIISGYSRTAGFNL
jgi:hypothetical protein